MTFNRKLLHFFVRDALFGYSENIKFQNHENPISINLNGVEYSIHVSYVHDSGNARANPDELRIQISKGILERQRVLRDAGVTTAFIGFFEGGNAFVAWEPEYALSQEPIAGSGSVYARLSHRDSAINNLAGLYQPFGVKLGRVVQTITLRPEALGFYLENIAQFHALQSENAIRQVLVDGTQAVDDVGLGVEKEINPVIDGVRKKFVFQRFAYPRNSRFRDSVISAYQGQCCICGRQLGLVQAAHIIPHSEPVCPDTVDNGLAMCIEHHRLYDDALLLPGPNQALIFNGERATYLRDTGQGRGLDDIEIRARTGYSLPADPLKRPRNDYLERGLSIRLG